MKVPLPISGQEAELRDFVPHRVALAFQEESAKALKDLPVDVLRRLPTKDELLEEFGEGVLRPLDELPPGEYEQRLELLQEQYLQRQATLAGVDLGNAHEANLKKVDGMLLTLNGQSATREAVLDLPHEDVMVLLEEIETIWSEQRKKKALARPRS